MNNIMLKFGSIFRHKEKEFVYLAQTSEILYSALILNAEMSEMLKKRCEGLCQKSSPQVTKILSDSVYCYVELRTEDFKNRLAHFAKTGENTSNECFPMPIGQLNKEDLKEIKKEIETGPVPLELRELTKDIIIES